MLTLVKRLLLLSVLLLACMLAFYTALHRYVTDIKINLSEDIIRISNGSSSAQLCHRWHVQQLVSRQQCMALKLYLRIHPELASVKQGVYRLTTEATALDLLALYSSGKEAQFSLTLIEGETVLQSLQRIKNAEFLHQDVQSIDDILSLIVWPADWGEQPQSAEAMLFPETYYYTADSKASDIIKRSQHYLLQALAEAWQQRLYNLPVSNPYQLLILASIIEKESRYDPEKATVASVFVNRLHKNMRLQTDPTVIYGLENFNGDITRADLNNPHPYNTYRHKGLPPGPISLVGKSSLISAANPADTDLYYFVAKGDGTHHFSATLQQHNAAVKRYILGSKE